MREPPEIALLATCVIGRLAFGVVPDGCTPPDGVFDGGGDACGPGDAAAAIAAKSPIIAIALAYQSSVDTGTRFAESACPRPEVLDQDVFSLTGLLTLRYHAQMVYRVV